MPMCIRITSQSTRERMAQQEAFRREAALQCLLVFLECAGDREDKVKAAVEYATLLTDELERTEAP